MTELEPKRRSYFRSGLADIGTSELFGLATKPVLLLAAGKQNKTKAK